MIVRKLQRHNIIVNHRFRLIGAAHGHPAVNNNNNGGASTGASAAAGSGSYAGVDKAPEANIGDYGHGSAAAATAGNGKPGSPMMVHTKTNYDDIFNVRVASSGGDVVQCRTVDTHTYTQYFYLLLILFFFSNPSKQSV